MEEKDASGVNEDIERQLKMLNMQIKELMSVYHVVASKSGISDNEFWVWYALLYFEDDLSQQDICEKWSLPKQTVNTIIANLTKRDLVFLKQIPGSRNRKNIHLSEKGRRYGENIVKRVYEAEHNTLSRLTEQERQTCIELKGKYIALLKEEIHEWQERKTK